MRCGWVVVLLVFLAGCGGARKAVRLEVGQGRTVLHVPRGDPAAVELDEDVFKEAVATLGQEARTSARPL